MIQKETNLVVADNSGARSVRAFNIYGGSKVKTGYIGDVILAAVKDATPNAKVKKGDVVRCIIVRTKKPIIREDGSTIAFDDNAVVLIKDDYAPVGTRVFGPIARELRNLNLSDSEKTNVMKIVSLAPEVL